VRGFTVLACGTVDTTRATHSLDAPARTSTRTTCGPVACAYTTRGPVDPACAMRGPGDSSPIDTREPLH
jgi:hypothetical protein